VAALVAWLYAPLYAVGYLTGVIPGIKGFIALFVGGTASPLGALVGGLLLGVLEVSAARYLPSIYSEGIAYMLLMIIVCVRATGLIAPRARGDGDERQGRNVSMASRRALSLDHGSARRRISARVGQSLPCHGCVQSLRHARAYPEPEFRGRIFRSVP